MVNRFMHSSALRRGLLRTGGSVLAANLILLLAVLLIDLIHPPVVNALSAGQVSIALVSGPWFVNDSNTCSGGAGPHAAYVVFRVTNTSGGTLTNLQAGLSGLNANFQLAGGQVITQYIGTLANNVARDVYWYVSYPCTMDLANTFTVTVVDGSPGSVSSSASVYTRSNISASAGGDLFNSMLGPGYVLGQIIPYTVTYDFGNITNDALTFQPAGNQAFNAGCFQLTAAEVISISPPGTFTGVAVGNRDLYYSNVRASGSNNYLTVAYSILYRCNGISTSATPYASSGSGTQYKYTSNYSATQFVTLFPAGSNPFTMTKSVTPRILGASGGVVTYTVRVTNTSAFDSQFDSITDTMTTNLTNAIYGGIVTASSQITSGNSSQIPNPGATGDLRWVGQPQGYYRVSAGSSVMLVFTETLGGGSGRYTNTVSANSGNSPITPAQAVVGVNDPTAAKLTAFEAHTANADWFIWTMVALVSMVLTFIGIRAKKRRLL